MSFVEFERWEIKEGHQEDHHEMIRTWFKFVREHQPELFAEWKSARYYREVDRDDPGAQVAPRPRLRRARVLPVHGGRR